MINPNTTPGMGKNNLTMELINSVSCPRHQDRPIAYFCKSCNEAVCVDCIFDSHNGHLLMNIGEMCKIASFSPWRCSSQREIEHLRPVKNDDEHTASLDRKHHDPEPVP